MKNKAVQGNFEVQKAGIDADVLEVMVKKSAITAIDSEEEMRRVEVNCLAEMLSEMKNLNTGLAQMLDVLTICGNEKIVDFFNKLTENMDEAKAEEDKGEDSPRGS